MKRVLIVDDDSALLKALPDTVRLRLKDVDVDKCDSAAAALSRLSASDYDVVVADIKMPGMDGVALLAEIGKLRPDTPTVLITGHGHDDLATLALRGGAYDFIQKPIDRDYFIASLTRAIEARQGRREREERRVLLEQHAEALEKIVEERTRELREANRLKDQFMATLSHELRSPLGAIRMWASLLRSGNLDAERTARALEAIERSAMTQARLIDDLLDVSRITAGKLAIDMRVVDPATVAETALDAVRTEAEAKEVRLEQAFELGGGQVRGDPARLQQIVWNLLSNAIKFSARGGRVVLRLARAEEQAILSVQDEGEGIAPDFLPHVFEPFRQGDSTSTRAHGGLGLGLAIVRDLVEVHHGTIEVESQGKGQGATFTVKLPLAPASEAAPEVAQQPALCGGEFHPSFVLRGVRVLLVDDDPSAREAVVAVLEQSGASVRAVGSAAEAVESLELEAPDVLLSDIAMPGMDGYALLGRARGRPHGARLPAAALSAYAGTTECARALAAGFQAHLGKPVDPAKLVAVVAQLAYTPREPVAVER